MLVTYNAKASSRISSKESKETRLSIQQLSWETPYNLYSFVEPLYKDAFYAPFLSDWRNYEAWEADGKITTEKRANRVWKQILEEFKPPPISSKIEGELEPFVQRREREGGDATNF